MEFKINSSDLLKALSHIHGIVEVRHTLPILSNIILEAKDNELTLIIHKFRYIIVQTKLKQKFLNQVKYQFQQ